MKAIDYPIAGKYLRKKVNPSESYDFWEHHYKGFGRPCKDLLSEDVTNKTKEKIQSLMLEILIKKRNRLLVEIYRNWKSNFWYHENI